MNTNKRKETMEDNVKPKRMKKECDYGEKCYRRNPAHFREYSHKHLEVILDEYDGNGPYPIPEKFNLEKLTIIEQLDVIVEKQLYDSKNTAQIGESSSSQNVPSDTQVNMSNVQTEIKMPSTVQVDTKPNASKVQLDTKVDTIKNEPGTKTPTNVLKNDIIPEMKPKNNRDYTKDSDYRPIVPPKRRAQDYLNVVPPKGQMEQKHKASAPYYIFYTTITDSKETHTQKYSITFQEILDSSLGELKCSLQINFMVELGWLLAQYYFAGYSEKKLTILYGEESEDLKTISSKKPQVDAHSVQMPTPFGKHHTKMMILCYEDGSLRVVISTANLYIDDWENRTQGLWFSPKCEELPPDAMPHDGESPTMFKKSLLRYLNNYHLPCLAFYVDRVKRCDFSHINVFLVASVPGSHFDMDWGMTRVGSLLRQHCDVPSLENRSWALVAQASSLGSYGKEAKLWLTGDFLHHFTKIKDQPQVLSMPPEIKVIYPSLENVRQSHDGLLGGGCLPYAAEAHTKQVWLNQYLYQWKAVSTHRNRAMPHIKSYIRASPDSQRAAFYLLTSANISKAAWGQINKGNKALRIMSYEAGVLFLPKFVINEDFFPLEGKNKLQLAYDLPPIKYTSDMSPWVSDYLM